MSTLLRRLTMAIPLKGPQTKPSPGLVNLASAIGIHGVHGKDRKADHRENIR